MDLITPRLKLREFKPADYNAMREIDSFPEMHAYEREIPAEADTQKALDEYIANQQETPRVTFRFAITIPPEDSVKGVLKLARNWEAIREWEIGWAMHPHEWGRGYATEAARTGMDWAFTELNCHRIVAYCHAYNAASVRVMEKLGMHLDGKLRETRWIGGKWWDEYIYSVLEREWNHENKNNR